MSGGRFPWVLTVAVLIAVPPLVGLGIWQVQRLTWKTELIATAEAAATVPRVPLYTAFQDRHGLDFRRVTVTCPGLAQAPYVEMRSIVEGTGGVRLYSLCRPEWFGFPFLVDRGFIADGITQRPSISASTMPTTIEGELREIAPPTWLTPASDGKTFYAPDVVGMPLALGATDIAGPLMIFATTSTNPELTALQPSAPPAAFSNNHLGYALTWFGLALGLVGVYVAMLRRTRLPQAAGTRGSGGREKEPS